MGRVPAPVRAVRSVLGAAGVGLAAPPTQADTLHGQTDTMCRHTPRTAGLGHTRGVRGCVRLCGASQLGGVQGWGPHPLGPHPLRPHSLSPHPLGPRPFSPRGWMCCCCLVGWQRQFTRVYYLSNPSYIPAAPSGYRHRTRAGKLAGSTALLFVHPTKCSNSAAAALPRGTAGVSTELSAV